MNRVGLHQQQLSRNLAFSTVDGRERLLRAFQESGCPATRRPSG
jgi:hypothetical protein